MLAQNEPFLAQCYVASRALHNCTTWATMAPIGDHGEPLKTLAGMPDRFCYDNAGYLSLFLTAIEDTKRAPVLVHGTDGDASDPRIASGQPFSWDFTSRLMTGSRLNFEGEAPI